MLISQLFSPDDASNRAILSELTWYDRSPLTSVLKANRGRWIHFTNTPKLGVNVRSMWDSGPKGVYFYPVDYLLTKTDRMKDGLQYGFNFKYYFLCDLDLSKPGIVLDEFTFEDARKIAERNGWLAEFDENIDPEEPSIGRAVWKLVRRLNSIGDITWNRAFRGVPYILDRTGVIYGDLEKQQIVVMDPKVIRNVEMGNNLNTTAPTFGDPNSWTPFMRRVMEYLQRKYGGRVSWKRDKDPRSRNVSFPTVMFDKDGKTFSISFVHDSWRGMSIVVAYTFGREKGQSQFPLEDLRSKDFSEIMRTISAYVKRISRLQSDLRFKPLLSEDEMKRVISERLTRGLTDMTFTTTVANGEFNSLEVVGRSVKEHEFGTVTIEARMNASDESLIASLRLSINDHQLIGVAVSGAPSADRAISKLASDLESLRDLASRYGPDAPGFIFRFHSDEQVRAFIGWVASDSGLFLDGRLRTAFSEEIAMYREHGEEALYRASLVFR